MNQQSWSLRALALGTLLSVNIGCAGVPPADGESTRVLPGVAAGAQATAVAIVEAVDMQTREVKLRREDGELVSLIASDEVRNLAQLEVGDRVEVEHTIGLVIMLSPASGTQPLRRDQLDVERAELGQKPGALVRQTVAVTGTVTAVDAETRLVTVKGPRRTVNLPVADDIDLATIRVGDEVDAVYQESIAISVKPAAAGR